MTIIAANGSNLRDLAFSGVEGDLNAFKIALEVIDDVCMNSTHINPASLKDITQRGNIEDNLGNIKKAIEMRKISGETRQFRIAGEIQKHFWEATNDKKIIIPEFPHHENIIWSGAEKKWVSQTGLIVAPLSYTFGPLATNPHSFDKTPQENIAFVANVDRLVEMIEVMAERFNLDPNEVAEAGSIYCNTVVGKRAWSIANKGEVEAGQVGPEHFLAVDNAIRATGYGMDFTRG